MDPAQTPKPKVGPLNVSFDVFFVLTSPMLSQSSSRRTSRLHYYLFPTFLFSLKSIKYNIITVIKFVNKVICNDYIGLKLITEKYTLKLYATSL